MVSLSARRSINLLNLKANVRVKIALCVLNGLAICLFTKMAKVPALALSLVQPLLLIRYYLHLFTISNSTVLN